MAGRLTDLDCRRAKPGHDLHDGNNLVLRVGANRRSWTLVWRDAGRVRKARLGDYPALGLSAARVAAHDGMTRVRQNLAPVATPAVPSPPLSPPKSAAGPSVETVLRNYIKLHVRVTARDPDQIEWVVDRLLRPVHRRSVASLKRADITHFLDEMSEGRGHASAYRAGSVLRAALRFALRRGEIETDPTHLLALPSPGRQRERVLTDQEVAAVWLTSVPIWSRLARILLLTGLRLREAANAPISELNGDLWLIPGARMKSSRPHAIPIFRELSEQLGDLHDARWLFRSPRRFDQPASGFYRGLFAVHRASETSDWTWHDLRRTVASGMQRLAAPHEVIEAMMAHRKPGVAAIYQRHDYLSERRDWFKKWAEFCARPPADRQVVRSALLPDLIQSDSARLG